MYYVVIIENGVPVKHTFSDRSDAAFLILKLGKELVVEHNVPELHVN